MSYSKDFSLLWKMLRFAVDAGDEASDAACRSAFDGEVKMGLARLESFRAPDIF